MRQEVDDLSGEEVGALGVEAMTGIRPEIRLAVGRLPNEAGDVDRAVVDDKRIEVVSIARRELQVGPGSRRDRPTEAVVLKAEAYLFEIDRLRPTARRLRVDLASVVPGLRDVIRLAGLEGAGGRVCVLVIDGAGDGVWAAVVGRQKARGLCGQIRQLAIEVTALNGVSVVKEARRPLAVKPGLKRLRFSRSQIPR